MGLSRMDVIELLIERDGFVCYLCEVEFKLRNIVEDTPDKVTIDHVVPRSRGGKDEVENYGLAHFKCNQEKADRMFMDDGNLEPKNSRESQYARRAHKRQIMERFCSECWDGRLLDKDSKCDYCGSLAGPDKWPWYAKKDPKICSHSNGDWCWMCTLDLIER